jgi:hypothetical protein
MTKALNPVYLLSVKYVLKHHDYKGKTPDHVTIDYRLAIIYERLLL